MDECCFLRHITQVCRKNLPVTVGLECSFVIKIDQKDTSKPYIAENKKNPF